VVSLIVSVVVVICSVVLVVGPLSPTAQNHRSIATDSSVRSVKFMGQAHSGEMIVGRDEEEQLSNRHVVLGTPLRPPFPDGIKLAVFATGCYWGAEKGFWRLPGMSPSHTHTHARTRH
jgi:hypothetical protein